MEKSHNKIDKFELALFSICVVKIEVENFEHLRWKVWKNGPHLSCDLHKIGANLYSKLAVAPFSCKKYGTGWMDEWMDGWVGGWIDGT